MDLELGTNICKSPNNSLKITLNIKEDQYVQISVSIFLVILTKIVEQSLIIFI